MRLLRAKKMVLFRENSEKDYCYDKGVVEVKNVFLVIATYLIACMSDLGFCIWNTKEKVAWSED